MSGPRKELSLPAELLCAAAGHEIERVTTSDDDAAVFCMDDDCLSRQIVALVAAAERVRDCVAILNDASLGKNDTMASLALRMDVEWTLLTYEAVALAGMQHGSDADGVLEAMGAA